VNYTKSKTNILYYNYLEYFSFNDEVITTVQLNIN